MKPVSICVLVLALFSTSCSSGHTQTYDSELNLGLQAFQTGRHEEAIVHFRKATELDPDKTDAHMYLATTYTSEYVPGVDTKENVSLGEGAVAQYMAILNSNASSDAKLEAAKGAAAMSLSMKRFDEARRYTRMVSGLNPKDPGAYYSVGVIDWTASNQPRMEARARLRLPADAPLDATNPAQEKVCEDLSARNKPWIADGIESLTKAIELRPDYDDAMTYLNLMYRERADVECNDPAARERDLKAGADWSDKSMATQRAKANQAASGRP